VGISKAISAVVGSLIILFGYLPGKREREREKERKRKRKRERITR